jgi:hypothetical protein
MPPHPRVEAACLCVRCHPASDQPPIARLYRLAGYPGWVVSSESDFCADTVVGAVSLDGQKLFFAASQNQVAMSVPATPSSVQAAARAQRRVTSIVRWTVNVH